MNIIGLIKGYNLPLVEVRAEAQNAHTFVFEKNDIQYRAGQHFILRLPHENTDNRRDVRVLSASSAPSEQYLTFTTRFFGEDSSSFKRAMMNLQPGDIVSVRGPSPLQDVYKVREGDQPYLFIAGGIGITPFRSIVTEYDDLNGVLFYGNSDQDFIFGEEIESKIAAAPNMKIKKYVSPDRVPGEDLQDALDRLGGRPTVFISGTIGFVDYYSNLLHKQCNLPRKHIKAYKYRGLFGSY